MIQKPVSVRSYKVTDAHLKQMADALLLCVQRDLSQFTTRGLTPSTLPAFQNLISIFANTPTDEEMLQTVSLATENKDAMGENLRLALRTIRTMAENKYQGRGAHYRAFGFDGMDALSDEELYRLAKRVARVATSQLSALATEGLTPAVIANLNTLSASFDQAIDAKIDAENHRDILTQDRIEKGNALYKEMVRLSNTGKDLFFATDEARYNDYVMYGGDGSLSQENTSKDE